jgi:hypothetical protein
LERKYAFHGRRINFGQCLSFLEALKSFQRKADIYKKMMIWQELDDRKIYHIVKWNDVCLRKDCGGLGVLDLITMNKSFLCKWLWKLENTKGTWHQLLTRKYVYNQIRCLLMQQVDLDGFFFGKI